MKMVVTDGLYVAFMVDTFKMMKRLDKRANFVIFVMKKVKKVECVFKEVCVCVFKMNVLEVNDKIDVIE